MRNLSSAIILMVIALVIFSSSVAIADPWKDESRHNKHWGRGGPEIRHGGGPPPWAPAHGHRAKYRKGRPSERDRYDDEYASVTEILGIPQGRCDRQALGGLLGGVVGGVLGSRVGRGDGKTIATIAGTVAGVLIGQHIGRAMDQADQQCVGQVLERAQDRQVIAWRNPYTDVEYQAMPQMTHERQGRYCREYITKATFRGITERAHGLACRGLDGTWRIVNQSSNM